MAIAQRKTLKSTLNCGYVGEDLNGFPENLLLNENDRWSCQLYWKLLEPYLKDGDRLLEIGCGLGGGLDFVNRWKRLDKAVGVDFAGQIIRNCKRRFGKAGIRFEKANALALPFEDASFDLVISIEVSHCIIDKKRYLDEALRVLRPGGIFIWADFVYRRQTSRHNIERCEGAISSSDSLLVETADLTAETIAALEVASDHRIAHIEQTIWKPLQPYAKDFAVTTQSSLYKSLVDSKAAYLAFVLKTSEIPR